MSSSSSSSSSGASASATIGGGGCGCTSIIIFFILVWALIFGVTVSGTHYKMTCSSESGVELSQNVNEKEEVENELH